MARFFVEAPSGNAVGHARSRVSECARQFENVYRINPNELNEQGLKVVLALEADFAQIVEPSTQIEPGT